MRFESISGNELIAAASTDFTQTALALYQYQYANNPLYQSYNDLLGINPQSVQALTDIPFLPISFFKSHKIVAYQGGEAQIVFDSSGTTGMVPSKHYVKDLALYESVSIAGFEQFYGNPKDWVILALLPSYLERAHSSLVHMAKVLMAMSTAPENGFYLDNVSALYDTINKLGQAKKQVLLLGVTFALLDFAERFPGAMQHVTLMETGGMKGRKEEWTRPQVHAFLQKQWQLEGIHSEYGMTELLSQAYATDQGLFQPISTMKVFVRELQDPLTSFLEGSGVLNIIDLANVHSCAFIATEDMARVYANGSFEVLGRLDFAALRGCSLLAL